MAIKFLIIKSFRLFAEPNILDHRRVVMGNNHRYHGHRPTDPQRSASRVSRRRARGGGLVRYTTAHTFTQQQPYRTAAEENF